jgi:hypothetical protein
LPELEAFARTGSVCPNWKRLPELEAFARTAAFDRFGFAV